MGRMKRRNVIFDWTIPLFWRRVILFGVMTAFFVQSFIAQTHIHHPSFPSATTAQLSGFAPPAESKVLAKVWADHSTPAHRDYPGNDDPAKCPLCQAVGQAGQFVWPSIAIFVLPHLPVATIPAAIILPPSSADHSYSWQSRGPPRF